MDFAILYMLLLIVFAFGILVGGLAAKTTQRVKKRKKSEDGNINNVFRPKNSDIEICLKKTISSVHEEKSISRYSNEHRIRVHFKEGGLVDFPPDTTPEIGDVCTIALYKERK